MEGQAEGEVQGGGGVGVDMGGGAPGEGFKVQGWERFVGSRVMEWRNGRVKGSQEAGLVESLGGRRVSL